MKRYATIIFSFTCATNLLFAQQDVWTIDKCMRYAIEHNFDVRANAISLDNSRSDYRQAVASFFPTIGASISADYSFGRSIDPSTNSYNNLKTFNNSYSLSASWTIFAGGQIVNQFRQAKKQREQSTEKLQNAKDETALKVMEAYVNLQYYRALSGITASKLEESRALLGKSRRMKELGMNSAIEVSQAEAQYAEDDYTHTATLGQLQTAELSLKNAMNFPISDTLRLPDPSTELLPFEATETNFNEIIDFARENNPLARQARLNVEISRDAVRQAKGALSPSISLQAGLSDSYYRQHRFCQQQFPHANEWQFRPICGCEHEHSFVQRTFAPHHIAKSKKFGIKRATRIQSQSLPTRHRHPPSHRRLRQSCQRTRQNGTQNGIRLNRLSIGSQKI